MHQYTMKDLGADGRVIEVTTATFCGDDEAVHFCMARLKAVPQSRLWIEVRQGDRLVATVVTDGHIDRSVPSDGGDAASMATAGYWEASMRGSREQDAGPRPHDHGSAVPPPRTSK